MAEDKPASPIPMAKQDAQLYDTSTIQQMEEFIPSVERLALPGNNGHLSKAANTDTMSADKLQSETSDSGEITGSAEPQESQPIVPTSIADRQAKLEGLSSAVLLSMILKHEMSGKFIQAYQSGTLDLLSSSDAEAARKCLEPLSLCTMGLNSTVWNL